MNCMAWRELQMTARLIGAAVFYVVLVASAHADTIRLREGSIEFQSLLLSDAAVHLEGRDFSFEGFAQLARLDAAECVFACDPDEVVSLFMTVSGNDLPGVVTWEGTEYTDVGSLISPNQMNLRIVGQMRLPHRLGMGRRSKRHTRNSKESSTTTSRHHWRESKHSRRACA
jgi:hypothetical protein